MVDVRGKSVDFKYQLEEKLNIIQKKKNKIKKLFLEELEKDEKRTSNKYRKVHNSYKSSKDIKAIQDYISKDKQIEKLENQLTLD